MTWLDNIIAKSISIISFPVWLLMTIWRHKIIRTLFIVAGIISALIYSAAGMQGLAMALQIVVQLLYAVGFMVIQFGALFWFISRTKQIEHRPGDEGLITFKDYFGNKSIVDMVKHWVKLLVNPKELYDMGAEALSGLLLIGPPGTGKTMLAMALASEGGAAFIGVAGTDFQGMFFGVPQMKVMNLFRKARSWAKEHGACVVFIDEIDAVAMSRSNVQGTGGVMGGMGGGMFGGGAMGILSRLLIEMDGLKEIPLRDKIQNRMRGWFGIPDIEQGQVLLMAATNRPDVLDPAIMRSGRFDKKISVDKPDKGSRLELVEGYLKKVKHDNVNVDALVQDTAGMSQADIAMAIWKDAPRIALFDGRHTVTHHDIEHALQEQVVGMQNPISDMNIMQKTQVAFHEAGHAVAAYHLLPKERIQRASIVRRSGGILGFVMYRDVEDVYAFPLSKLKAMIGVSQAGHIATELQFGEPWTGAGSDFKHISLLLKVMAIHKEFGKLPTGMGDPLDDKEINEAAHKFEEAMAHKTKSLLSDNWEQVEALALALLKKETLTSEEIYSILREDDEIPD